ncbi:MAG: glycosyltransferase [Patescibacteria group bacterium]|jgi:GT2 family glycosyltransferase
MTVTVAIVTRNGAAYLPKLLQSLDEQTFHDFETSFLDNASTDASVEIVKEWLNNHQGFLTEERENTGFASAYNKLIQDVTTPYILVLNQDVVLDKEYLSRLVSQAVIDKQVGVFSGILLRFNMTSTRPIFTQVIDAFGLKLFRTHRAVEWLRGQDVTVAPKISMPVFGVPATAALYRMDALKSVAIQRSHKTLYFDDLFFAYKEDVDIAYRLQLKGWGSVVVPQAVAYHYRTVRGEVDSGSLFNSVTKSAKVRQERSEFNKYQSYRNHLFFLFGTVKVSFFSLSFWLTLIYEVGKCAYLIFTSSSHLRAWKEVYQVRRELREKRLQVQG